jgi:hypothetical protein
MKTSYMNTIACGTALVLGLASTASTVSAQIVPEPSTPVPSQPAAPAPDWPLFDVSGGLSLVRMSPGPDLDRAGLVGWSGSFSFNATRRLGIVAEIAGARRTPELEDTLVPDAPVSLRQTSFLVGPTFRMMSRGPLTARMRAMVGAARLTSEFPSDQTLSGIVPGQTPQDIGIFEDETAFAAAFGTAWDIRLARALALRVNPTFMLTRFNGETQFTQRLSTGLVVSLGPRGQE